MVPPGIVQASGPGVERKSSFNFLLWYVLTQTALALLASVEQEWICLDGSYEVPTKCQGWYQLLGDTKMGKIWSLLPGSSQPSG